MSYKIHAADAESCAASATSAAAISDLQARLFSRPPLDSRVGVLATTRCQEEAKYRLGEGFKDETHPAGVLFGIGVWVLRTGLKLLGLYRRGVNNARSYRVVTRTVDIPGLPPELEGFRILHLSDLHLPRRLGGIAPAMGRALAGVEAELCVLTGDYRFGYFGPPDHIAAQLHAILDGVKPRYGTIAVLGNHDTFAIGQLLERSGFPILYNEGVALAHNGAVVWICGVDETHNYGCDRIDEAVVDAPADAFKVLLVHTPERVAEAAGHGVDLYLTGHTHGGQIRLPFIGAPLKNAKCARDQVWGVWRHERMVGHTTCGLGVTDVPVRFNCPPEAALLVLRRQNGSQA